jgi:hypothetical protein
MSELHIFFFDWENKVCHKSAKIVKETECFYFLDIDLHRSRRVYKTVVVRNKKFKEII